MAKQPQRKHCKTCQTLIPIGEWPDHKKLHDDQLTMPGFDQIPVVDRQLKRIRRPRGGEGLA